MKHKLFRKPRIRKFGGVTQLTHQQPQGFQPKGEGTQPQGRVYEVM